ncbi:hypothetical protein ACT3CD_14640 [Geofilum sp. OHC36d9]|uniref:hypothetical protein n=1 Tax=Geofilum sp. OHC36d9 TaxID=3458413 RepID=UPI004034EE50
MFDFTKGAGKHFENMMNDLAQVSGYRELANVPVIPIGHSACASFPWNFAAWNPQRTLCAISQHGDAPLTLLTGSGHPNPDWGNRTIQGVPGIMIEGEYEWWEARVQPALDYKSKYPKAAISFLCDAGHGHFDVSKQLADYILLFIKKAVKYRLPKHQNIDDAPILKSIYPETGWLKERWKKDTIPTFEAAPYNKYKGDKNEAFWYFDKEIAQATEDYYQRVRGKKEQYIGFTQNGALLKFDENLHARMVGAFEPQNDGLTFSLNAIFTDTLRQKASNNHAPGKPLLSKICGPVKQVGDTIFEVSFYRMGFNSKKRTGDIWLLASHPGNEVYKSTVQQFNMRIPHRNREGAQQKIIFSLPDSIVFLSKMTKGEKIKLNATATSGLPVHYYVYEGPAEINNGMLEFKNIPPRSKYPIKVTVVAWQYGRNIEPKIQTAIPVKQSFIIEK